MPNKLKTIEQLLKAEVAKLKAENADLRKQSDILLKDVNQMLAAIVDDDLGKIELDPMTIAMCDYAVMFEGAAP